MKGLSTEKYNEYLYMIVVDINFILSSNLKAITELKYNFNHKYPP